MPLNQRPWPLRVSFRLYLGFLLALCVVAFLELVRGEFLRAGVTVAVLLADFLGSAAVVVSVVACLLAGAPLSALLASAIVVVKWVGRNGGHLGIGRRGDSGASGRDDVPLGWAKLGWLIFGVNATATVWAYVAAFAELVWDLLRWLAVLPVWVLKLPGRALRSLSKRNREGRIGPRLRRLIAPWRSWPPLALLLWLCVRPLLALAALIFIVGFGSLGIWIGIPVGLLAIGIRSIRWPLVPLLVAVAVTPVSIAGALLLTLRVLLGEGVVWWLGRRGGARGARRLGLEAVAAARLDLAGRLTGYSAESLAAARSAFANAVEGEDEDAVLDSATSYGLAAWASWRWLELIALVRSVAGGVLRGRWVGPVEEGGLFDREFMSAALLEELFDFLGRRAVLLIAAAVAFFTIAGPGGAIGGEDLLGRCAVAVAVMLVAGPLTERRPALFLSAFWAAVAFVALGSIAWSVIAIAIAAAFASHALRRLIETLSFSGRARWRDWPPPKWRPWRLRRRWLAAAKAIDTGEERIGVEILKELAAEADSDREYFAAALGRAALVEVDLGRLQAAAEHLDRISSTGELEGVAAVAAGMLANALGDFERAASLLESALARLDDSSPLVPRATLTCVEALARSGKPEQALALVKGIGSRPLAMRGVAAMLEAQAAIAAALVERSREDQADRERAVTLLSQFDGFFGSAEEEISQSLGTDATKRLQRAQAQLLALRGQLLLGRQTMEAEKFLRRAVTLAAEAGDEALQARAQVLHGSALARSGNAEAGASTIVQGVDVLEARRVQLRAAERRTAMIAAGETLYSAALDGLFAAQGRGCERAGIEGARLLESLRQSALAATLRSGRLPLDPHTQGAIGRVLAGEGAGADVEELRAAIGEQISAHFAAAYLPTPVTAAGLRDACRGFDHVLAFHIPPGGLPGWRVWIGPSGEADLAPVGSDRDDSSLLTAIVAGGRLPDEQIHVPLVSSAGAWERLGEELLPLEMRKALLKAERPQRVLVIPDGPLALVPWAALCIGGRPLVESAIVQLAPSLELAGDTPPGEAGERVIAHLGSAGDGAELRGLRDHAAVQVETSRSGFLGALESGRFDGAYIASHGRAIGLGQQIEFADGSTLSAAAALAYDWPQWTVFSSCLVGRVEQLAGREPFGLAISCMLRGAGTVLASVVELSEGGARACGEAAAGMARGSDRAEALRSAQLRQLEGRRLSSLADGLGLVCISRVAPSQRSRPLAPDLGIQRGDH